VITDAAKVINCAAGLITFMTGLINRVAGLINYTAGLIKNMVNLAPSKAPRSGVDDIVFTAWRTVKAYKTKIGARDSSRAARPGNAKKGIFTTALRYLALNL